MQDVLLKNDAERSRLRVIRWPTRILGPTPGLREINLVCWGLFVGFLILPLFVPIALDWHSGAGSLHILPNDFVYFYGDGRIVNEYPLARLYDYPLQLKVFNGIFELHNGSYGPSPYPPFVGLFFSSFARLPFVPAYFLWISISFLLYFLGIWFAIKAVYAAERLKTSLVFCFALAFYPFVFNTLINGQLASVAVFVVGLVLLQESRGRPHLSGLALAVLAYKPTLLLLIVPMLLLTRRFKALAGFITGVAALFLVATAFGGFQIWWAYLRFLEDFRRVTGLNGQSVLPLWEYVDFSSFSYAIPGGRSPVGLGIFMAIGGVATVVLAVVLWRSSASSRPAQLLAWATTLTWTLLLNVYIPVYDSILVTIAVILTLGALRALQWSDCAGWTVLLGLLMFIATCYGGSFFFGHGNQLFTVLLFVLGFGQLALLAKLIRRPVISTEPVSAIH